MKKCIAALTFLAVLLQAPVCAAPDAGTGAPEVSAQSAIVVEASTGAVLYEKDADTSRPMASTTKLMTALVAVEAGGLDEVVTVPRQAVGVEGSSVYLQEGEHITVRELIYATLLCSGNDATEALAYHCGDGERSAFVQMMNDKAAQLGLENTQFENPSGLPDDGHYTTARELAEIGRAVSRDAFLAGVVGTKAVTLQNEDGYTRRYVNHNTLLKLYEYADGMKTGFTKAAGRCLVSSATRDGIKLICVTLHAPDDWNDHIRMLDYGFSRVSIKEAAAAGALACHIPVGGGTEALVTAVNQAPVAFPAVDGKTVEYTVEFVCPEFVLAPVKQGQAVAEARYYCGEQLVLSVPLAAVQDVPARPFVSKWEIFRKNFAYIMNLVLP